MHRLEIEELRKALEGRASDLQRMEREKEKVSSDKDNVARTVAGLEADLQRVKRDAEAFGRDLKAMRAEKEKLEARSKDEIAKAERAKKQTQAQIRILTEQLNAEKDKASKAIESRAL
jgi:septal ring factor EnvC (AmiA/AmiB activator)